MQFRTDQVGELYPVANKTETNPAMAAVQRFLRPLAKVHTGYQPMAQEALDSMELLLNGLRPSWEKELAQGTEVPVKPPKELA